MGPATVGLTHQNSGEMTQNDGHYVVQGHSRLSILVPIESPSATSY